ncbi:hypothetical protein GCM10007872_30270 [Gluconobacter sphaericus NBRC 12467]|uniref:Uncharacterized protein n=1 Tax=Gluconobacter sphaericus NBRC 12467 TaxID=1307951 RepID=A0AA37SKX7_9PROT|nr:hypothetical protein GCM10007872_30270 [Gluconobacter sphaericus NBRC 12467]
MGIHFLNVGTGSAVKRRKKSRVFNVELRTGCFDLMLSNLKVTIVNKCRFYQILKYWITIEITPVSE